MLYRFFYLKRKQTRIMFLCIMVSGVILKTKLLNWWKVTENVVARSREIRDIWWRMKTSRFIITHALLTSTMNVCGVGLVQLWTQIRGDLQPTDLQKSPGPVRPSIQECGQYGSWFQMTSSGPNLARGLNLGQYSLAFRCNCMNLS